MNIKKVRSNLKVGCDVELGHKTVIVGPNGSGKSTIINAVELALTSRASDIAGRSEVAREADLLSLAPKDAKHVYAEVEFDDGEIAKYAAEGSTAKAKKAVVSRPDAVQHEEVLPLRTLREAVLGSATTARKYLLSKVSRGTTRADVRGLLPAPTHALWDKLIATIPADVETADALVTVLEEAGKRMRSATEEAKTARGAAKLVGDGFVSPPTAAEIEDAKALVKAAREVYAKAEGAASAQARIEAAVDRVEKLSAEAEKAVIEFKEAEEAFNAIPVPESADLLKALSATMEASSERGVCMPCGGSSAGIAARLAEVKAMIAETGTLTKKRDSAQSAVTQKRSAVDRAITALEVAEAEVVSLSELKAGSSGMRNVSETEADLDAAQKKLSTLTAARDNWAIVQRSEATALDAERRSAEWKNLKDACEGAVATVLDKAISQFVDSVQSHLPPTDKFDLRLRDGEREVVQFGLLRDGALHTALSGAEWARVTVAMAEACVGPDEFAVLIPEERAFDAKTLSGVLKALTDSPHQVILASPVAPKPVPKGWTVIERGEA